MMDSKKCRWLRLSILILGVTISVSEAQNGAGTRGRNGNGYGVSGIPGVGGDYEYNGYDYEEYNIEDSDESKYFLSVTGKLGF